MAAKLKEASIGGTVNLEGYENLRFDFTAEIETPNDYMDLVAFAAGCLIGQARASKDPTGLVQEKLLGYVVRVTGVTEDQLPNAGKDQPKDITPENIDTATAAPPPRPKVPAAPHQKTVVKDGPSHGMETKTANYRKKSVSEDKTIADYRDCGFYQEKVTAAYQPKHCCWNGDEPCPHPGLACPVKAANPSLLERALRNTPIQAKPCGEIVEVQ
ncbi:MAG: hypothetical protein QMD46_12410 [Methanomicrobiales archaeon]|nr:hypothetical protein [Methanomicrobiales archaeon]